jgi:integrase
VAKAKILTERTVKTAKPKADRYGIADGIIPGQRLLVHPSGEKSYVILPRLHGKQITITIGDAALMTLAEARTRGRAILAAIADGIDPREVRQQATRTASETVEAVVRLYIERYQKVYNRTWEEVEWRLTREIIPAWGRRPITSISRRDVIELLDAIVDRGVPVTANRTLTVGRKMFSWAIERSLIETSPFDHVKSPAQEVPRDRTHTDAELALILRATEALSHPFGLYFKLSVLLGQRREEIAGMRWGEFNASFSTWTLPRERAKNGIEHLVPLCPWASAIITGLPRFAGSEFVFTTNGRTSISGFSKAKTALDAAITEANGGTPIPSWRLHDLRRSMASTMARLGVALPVVEKLLNHVSGTFSGVQGIYQRHDFAEEKRQALESWAQHLLRLVECGPESSRNPPSRALA